MSTPALSILLAAAMLGSVCLPVSHTGMAYAAAAESKKSNSESINGIRSLLHNGNPEIAKNKAFTLLKTGQVNDRERRSLLRVIAVAEEMSTALHEYTDADVAIAAWQNLLKEFVSPDDAAGIRWKICWLYWKKGDAEASSRAAEELLKENPGSPQAREARLLLAKMNVENGKLHSARKNLMKYVLDSDSDTDQAQGLAWMAVVDFMEQRNDVAMENMIKAINLAPGLVSSHVTLLSSYVQLLYTNHNQDAFLRQASRFFSLYLDRHEAMLIRLLYANVLAEQGKTKEALQSYERLSEVAPETSVGMKAFMRKMMLQNATVNDLESLKPVLAALHKLAVDNQISDIEDEAMFDQALLWTRLAGQVDKSEEKALDLYTQVSVGTVAELSALAKGNGYTLFAQHLTATLEQQAWLESIVLWRRYAQLREAPVALEGNALKQHRDMLLGVAGAMRRLMDFDAADDILAALYKDTQNSVEGDRVMLEHAVLWQDRHDPQGYARIMRWLDTHSFTLYRPEMLLIAAGIQLQRGQPSQASQTLKQISEADIAPDRRAAYWLTRAEIAEALDQWYSAASAWSSHISLLSDKPGNATLLRKADALYMAGEFDKALPVYLKTPGDQRNNRWQYRMAVCEMRTGQWSQAEERLNALVQNTEAAEYATRARLLLADRAAIGLMDNY